MTGKLILVNRFFTKNLAENESYFGVKIMEIVDLNLGASYSFFL